MAMVTSVARGLENRLLDEMAKRLGAVEKRLCARLDLMDTRLKRLEVHSQEVGMAEVAIMRKEGDRNGAWPSQHVHQRIPRDSNINQLILMRK